VAEWRLRGGHRMQLQVPEQAPAAEALLSRAGFEAWMLDFVQRPVRPVRADVPAGVRLRPVTDADGERVTGLLSEFGAPRTPAAERMPAVLRTFDEHLRRVEAGEARTTVAEADGEMVGVCSLEWRGPFWTAETYAWLPDLIVTEPARGRGIGRALLADAVAAAAAHGAAQLSLESGRTRTAAHGLYRSSGFADTGQTYRLLRAVG
jgi:GNAT superfamily N-acetyltransferase